MTPKEKAEYLVAKHTAKTSLIIANEMLENAGFIWGKHYNELALSARDAFRKYWCEVITEIKTYKP
jgi:hypothetical protein